MSLADKLVGALYGVAIGDAMGAPVEGWPPERIRERFTDVAEFLPPTHGGDPTMGKGAGRVTDDTLMTEALMRAYGKAREHMDAYGYERFFLPEFADAVTWIPERQQELRLIDRLWWAEKYPWIRIRLSHVEPRAAGIGNMVNCGIAMYMMPVGAVNAGDPAGAYEEAAAFGLAHNESFAVEAGAVTAAAYASAFGKDATIELVCNDAMRLAEDGTRPAIEAALNAASPEVPLDVFIAKTRAAVAPFAPQARHVGDDEKPGDSQGQGAAGDFGRPSRFASVEELPVALAALRYGNGAFSRTLKAAVFYGRDCDSIAGMACGLLGGLGGRSVLPGNLARAVDAANRRDFSESAKRFLPVVTELLAADRVRLHRRGLAVES